MNQADVTKLVSRLRVAIKAEPRGFANRGGPDGKFLLFRKTLTALIKYERIELNYHRADEARGYVERLISEAIRHGDCHRHTMEMASHWILEKQYVHKLFQVLVPRFQNMPVSYTRLYKAPFDYPGHGRPRAVLELRGHPFPPLLPERTQNRNMLHNVLLDAAKREFRRQKYAAIAASIVPGNETIAPAAASYTATQEVIEKKPVAEAKADDTKSSE